MAEESVLILAFLAMVGSMGVIYVVDDLFPPQDTKTNVAIVVSFDIIVDEEGMVNLEPVCYNINDYDSIDFSSICGKRKIIPAEYIRTCCRFSKKVSKNDLCDL